jgi:hypothetical protein
LQNPWKEFEESGYMIHPKDEAVIKLHNDSVDKKYRFLLHLAPEPWIGSINSSLVVLYANPGATDFDLTGKPQFKAREINRLARTNLRQEPSLFPHFFFFSRNGRNPRPSLVLQDIWGLTAVRKTNRYLKSSSYMRDGSLSFQELETAHCQNSHSELYGVPS